MDRRNGFSPAQLEELNDILNGHKFNEEQIEQISTKAAAKAIEQMTNDAYRAVGKTVVDRFLWLVGLIAVAAASWAAGKGLMK